MHSLLALFALVLGVLLGCGPAPRTPLCPKPHTGCKCEGGCDCRGECHCGKSKIQGTAVSLTDYQKALDLAKTSNKPVFLDFSAKWCGPCREMGHTFESPVVRAKLADYVTLFADYDGSLELARKFGVISIPAYYVLASDGSVVKAGSGLKGPIEFTRWLGK